MNNKLTLLQTIDTHSSMILVSLLDDVLVGTSRESA